MIRIIIAILILGVFQSSYAQSEKLLKPKFELEVNEPVRILKTGDESYFIDFGKAFFGTLTIESQSSQKDPLIVHLGEQLSQENTINRSPKGTIRYQKVKLIGLKGGVKTDIILSPDKRNTNNSAIQLPDSFGTIMPFRYCEIENLKISLDKIKFSQKAFLYEFNDSASSFHSSDTVLNQIWDLCKHTIKATSFAGYYIDGDRERIPYEADAYINQLSHYAVDSVYSLARRTNEYFINHPTWPTEWILHTAKMFYYDYLYTGDANSIKKHYPSLKAKTLMELAREDGLISTHSTKVDDHLMQKLGFKNTKRRIKDIVDWPLAERDDYDFKAINTVVNSFYYENLHFMSLLAEVIGNKEDSAFYKNEANKVKGAINNKLFNASRGVYVDGEGSKHASLHANMFALAFGIVPEKNIGSVIDYVKGKGMACSVYGAQYLLEGLYRYNEGAYAKQLIVDTTNERTWWNMIKSGATITLEAWDIKFKPNLDWNHAWGTAPLNIITRNMWGIRPTSPGFVDAEVFPQLDGIDFSEITVPTIKGAIHAKFTKSSNGNEVFEIQFPEGINGQFIVPNEKHKELRLNGKIIKSDKKIPLVNKLNIIEIRY